MPYETPRLHLRNPVLSDDDTLAGENAFHLLVFHLLTSRPCKPRADTPPFIALLKESQIANSCQADITEAIKEN